MSNLLLGKDASVSLPTT